MFGRHSAPRLPAPAPAQVESGHMADNSHDDKIDIDVILDHVILRCGDKSFTRICESLKSQPGAVWDAKDDLSMVTIEKSSAFRGVAAPASTWWNRLGLFGCGLVALVVIFGLVNGAREILNLLR